MGSFLLQEPSGHQWYHITKQSWYQLPQTLGFNTASLPHLISGEDYFLWQENCSTVSSVQMESMASPPNYSPVGGATTKAIKRKQATLFWPWPQRLAWRWWIREGSLEAAYICRLKSQSWHPGPSKVISLRTGVTASAFSLLPFPVVWISSQDPQGNPSFLMPAMNTSWFRGSSS